MRRREFFKIMVLAPFLRNLAPKPCKTQGAPLRKPKGRSYDLDPLPMPWGRGYPGMSWDLQEELLNVSIAPDGSGQPS